MDATTEAVEPLTADEAERDLAADLHWLIVRSVCGRTDTIARAACRRALAAEEELARLRRGLRNLRDQVGPDQRSIIDLYLEGSDA